MSMDEQNPIPTAVKELLALFDGPLASVTFPDVDGVALREQAASVDAAVREVEAAAAAWAEAKRTVDARLEVLLQKAQRALAYARIYAEDKPELDASLAALIVPRWGDPRGTKAQSEVAPARKRGRPKKGDTTPAPAKVEPIALPEPIHLAEPAPSPGPILLAPAADSTISADSAPVSDSAAE